MNILRYLKCPVSLKIMNMFFFCMFIYFAKIYVYGWHKFALQKQDSVPIYDNTHVIKINKSSKIFSP